MSRTTRATALLIAPFALVALVACGDDSGSEGGAPAATNAAATTAAPTTAASSGSGGLNEGYGGGYAVPPTEPAAATGEAGVQLADNAAYGKILVDAEGRTLYVFMFDTEGRSVCDATCTSSWPPLVAEGELTVSRDLAAGDFASITRDDGTMQVTFHGQALYHYGGDQEPGDTNGQGINEVWYVVDADGNPITE